ncbi:MAG TPA: hypothetical protein VI504_00215 [Candidatus Eisenbacteria bacterium]|jgi:hypothetical protein
MKTQQGRKWPREKPSGFTLSVVRAAASAAYFHLEDDTARANGSVDVAEVMAVVLYEALMEMVSPAGLIDPEEAVGKLVELLAERRGKEQSERERLLLDELDKANAVNQIIEPTH